MFHLYKTLINISMYMKTLFFLAVFSQNIRIYHGCEGQIEKSVPKVTGITRLTEWSQSMIPNNGFFCLVHKIRKYWI